MAPTHRSLLIVLLFVLIGALFPAGVLAQGAVAWDQIACKATLSQSDRDAVDALVKEHVAGLDGQSAGIRRARSALLAPLQVRCQVSVAFRLEMSQRLLPAVRSLSGNAREEVAINAVRIMGELGTATSLDAASERLPDKRAALRRMAAAAIEQTFRIMAGSSASVSSTQANKAITALAARFGEETDSFVLDGVALALNAAMQVPGAALPGVRDFAMSEGFRALGARISRGPADPAAHSASIRMLGSAQSVYRNQVADPPGESVRVLTGGFVGHCVAYARRRVKAADLSLAEREELVTLVRVAERTLTLVRTNQGVDAASLADMLDQGKDEEFLRASLGLIGPNGLLTGSEFGFADDFFVKPGDL